MDAQSKINALWVGAAKMYDETPRHGISDPGERAAWEEALRRFLPSPPAEVLDVGTGTGVIALLCASLGHHVRGVDLVEAMLENARENARRLGVDVKFSPGDAMDPPGDPESLDVVINRHLLWTLTDPPRALRNWHRLLRPGGRLVIIDGLWAAKEPDPRLGDLADSLPLTKSVTLDEICELVRRAGYVDAATSDLAEVERVERELHGEPDDPPRYVLTAAKPG